MQLQLVPAITISVFQSRRSNAQTFLAQSLFHAAWGLVFIFLAVVSARAQDSAGPSSATQDMSVQSGDARGNTSDASGNVNPLNDGSMAGASSLTVPAVLSSDQIVRILQQNPDLVEELKSQAADRMQTQGMQVNANDISDQMLYQQIASSASLRASITSFLRAGGYVSDEELQMAGTSGEITGGGASSASLSSSGRDRNGTSISSADAEQDGSSEGGPLTMRSSSGSAAGRRSSSEVPRAREQTNASTDLPKVVHQPTPYNLRSLHDLYTQIPEQNAPLKRFGSDVFMNRDLSMSRGVSGRDTPPDVPVGPDYVVGPGDMLTIDLWGGVTQSLHCVIDRDGHILLPEAGSLQIAGLPLGQAERLIEGALKQQYRNAQVAVTVSRLHSVRVYVVGDVQRPGGYDISSLATPLNALYAAGGPTSAGSLRIARHYRGKQLIEEVDLYDFLLHGIRNGSAHFESGDTLLVPPTGAQVAIFGAIKRPAIYELKAGESRINSVIDDAGGFTAAASPAHITIERIDASRQRKTITLNSEDPGTSQKDQDSLTLFEVKDGDRIRIESILSYSLSAIYLTGHVVRPGRWPFSDGMRLSDVLRSYRDLLPEPSSHGEIIRLTPPDLHAETIGFDVAEVLAGNANVNLQAFDTIRVFGRYETDAPQVSIRGEVLRPGTYPMSSGMTAAKLVRMAGGFKRAALLDTADLASHDIANGNAVKGELAAVRIGAAVAGADPGADVLLKPGDILTVHQITGWNDIGQSVQIEGQARYPGTYGFQEGERLSSVMRRAGGMLPDAYPAGAVLVREQVRDLEQKSRDELIRQIETNSAAARLSPSLAGANGGGALQLIKAQQDEVLAELKSHPPAGRMVIHINANIDSWANTPADIELRRGDVLTIPKQPGFVLVTGQVYNATALTYAPGKSADWYLGRAGGTNATASRKEIFIIRANGSVVGRHSGGWFDSNVLSTQLNPGDVVVVPQKVIGASMFWRNLMTTGQLAASIAITAGIAASTL